MATRPILADELMPLGTGAWILGAGGGGDPYHALLNLQRLYRDGRVVQLMDPSDLADDATVAVVSTMGTPLVGEERLTDPVVAALAVRQMEKHLGRRFDAVMSLEIGGANAFQPLMVAAEMGIPVVDADTMGRAYPEAQHSSFAIGDLRPYPLTLADVRGNAVVVGTTHFTNAVVQRRNLAAIARGAVFMVEGGHEVDGRPLVPFDETATREAAERIRDQGIGSVAVSAVFSPLTPECEERAAAIVRDVIPGVSLTCSHELGRIGLLERENAAILNAALLPLARHTVRAFVAALEESGIQAPLYLTQNDGTVMRAEFAEAFPVWSFSSGPTNSMRGAAYLSGLTDAMVVDVGGTTTDIGHLKAGFPREANRAVEIGGVCTLFRMPDLLSLGLGGGSLVDLERREVGPRSVGYLPGDALRVRVRVVGDAARR